MCAGEGSLRIKGFEQFTKADGLVFSSMRHCGDTCRPFALVKFTWNGDMPYNGVEWGLAFPVRAICLHRERESVLQVPVEGLPVPGDFHGGWNRIPKVIMGMPYCRNVRTPVATSTAAGSSTKGLSSLWPMYRKLLEMKGKAGPGRS